jgi:signal peptidase I
VPGDDVDVIERLREAVEGRSLDVPVVEIVRRGHRRRSDRRRMATFVLLLVTTVVVGRAGTAFGPTVAGFAVERIDGRSVIAIMEPSANMEPTIGPGDIVAVVVQSDRAAVPSRDDIVAFRLPNGCDEQVLFKRVIGLPGDTVEERDGILYVDGAALDVPREAPHGAVTGTWTVEAGRLFVVGDNLGTSNDSRYENGIGQVPIADVIGVVDLSIDVSDANVSAPAACAATVQRGSTGSG